MEVFDLELINALPDSFEDTDNIPINIEFSDPNINPIIYGRNKAILQAEIEAGVIFPREAVWVDGAENTEGIISLPYQYDKVYVIKGTYNEPQIIYIDEYVEGMERPYYIKQADGTTSIYVNGFSGGGGSQVDPYLIHTATDLVNINNNKSAWYKQMADIDLSTFGNWTPLCTPAAPFTGYYDGNGFKIQNMSCLDATYVLGNSRGFFSRVSNVYQYGLTNMTFENATVQGTSNVGTVAGELTTSVRNIKATGNITFIKTGVGGLFGTSTNGAIMDCNFEGNITQANGYTGYGSHGGIAGSTTGSFFGNCKFIGNIYSKGMYVGGIAGQFIKSSNAYTDTIDGCEVRGIIEGWYNVGGLAGYAYCSATTANATYPPILTLNGNLVDVEISKSNNTYDPNANGFGGIVGVLNADGSGTTQKIQDNKLTVKFNPKVGINMPRVGSVIGWLRGYAKILIDHDVIIPTFLNTSLTTEYTSITGVSSNTNGANVVEKLFYNKDTLGYVDASGFNVFGKTEAEMKTQALYTGATFDFTTKWYWVAEGLYPELISIREYQVLPSTSPTQLGAIVLKGYNTTGQEVLIEAPIIDIADVNAQYNFLQIRDDQGRLFAIDVVDANSPRANCYAILTDTGVLYIAKALV